MGATLLVRAGKRYYKVRVNPVAQMSEAELDKYATLLKYYIRASKRKELALMIRLDRRIRRLEEQHAASLAKNPWRRGA